MNQKKKNSVTCDCGFPVFDGEVIRSRVIRLCDEQGQPLKQALAKCKCKRWVGVPVSLLM